jgi:sterol desaturase/sphingolipid hydroxylase (fatty acid hydroxylase superfamily)
MQNETANMLPSQLFFGLAILAFMVLLVMEKLKPYRLYSSEVHKASVFTNTTAFLFNNVILTALRATSLFFVAQQYSSQGLLSGIGNNNPIKWILAFLLYDLAIYFWHVISHKYEFLWRFHKVHHSDKSFNASTGFRFHVFDLFLEIPYKCLFVILIGVDAYLVLAIETIQLFFIFFHHANISFENEKPLSQFIITPSLHRTHHSTLRSEHDSNYGIVLAFWDKLFGTRKELIPEKIGLDIVVAENFTQLFFLAFITERSIKKILHIIPKGRKT